ncbi:hypothetical protein SEVIR_1G353366v4 [Setaria viridis]|uniref:Uncharacterized protein n=1 Tax=Setaria viridis TaxID=4556 RepID=A0A4V6DDL2_SETVI|nr:hypothetical protein SEVIR_1G353366v2 [Setaria viridis]
MLRCCSLSSIDRSRRARAKAKRGVVWLVGLCSETCICTSRVTRRRRLVRWFVCVNQVRMDTIGACVPACMTGKLQTCIPGGYRRVVPMHMHGCLLVAVLISIDRAAHVRRSASFHASQ